MSKNYKQFRCFNNINIKIKRTKLSSQEYHLVDYTRICKGTNSLVIQYHTVIAKVITKFL